MRVVNLTEQRAEEDFARRAAECFMSNPSYYTFADGDPKPGELFAIRWNPFTVLVVKLDEMHVPACYPSASFVGKDFPPLKGEPRLPESNRPAA